MTAPVFETSSAALQWLTRAVFLAEGERTAGCVVFRVWQAGVDPLENSYKR